MFNVMDPSRIDLNLDCRAVTFENPTGDRGAAGKAARGRKGAPQKLVQPGERVVLADLRGPGTVRHIWMTFPPAPPEQMRALVLEVFYDDRSEPSISVPCLDFFGASLGRPVPYDSALTSVHEGRGFNAYFPMPFRNHLRVEMTNRSERRVSFYYQIDYSLEPEIHPETGYLHVSFRRENPTKLTRDFVIEEGLEGPGRVLGCNIGIRVLDGGDWYGEGEVKVYRDGDSDYPTLCGTGLEDYVGSAWGMGPHSAWFAGAPLISRGPDSGRNPSFVSFYRWHVPDPIVYQSDLRVTIQQIGAAVFGKSQEKEFKDFAERHPAAGSGWEHPKSPQIHAHGLFERVDDYCATSYVYCRVPQSVPRLEIRTALADIERLPYETPSPMERIMGAV
jgi:hypothetical protein